ncbi:MAG: flagellar motor protein MotB [Pseudomonadota bacterium]
MTRNDEIIILKRPDEHEEKKKGGVWKIAHADFMTAMMAFFLIMWLVNATDEEIKKSIANYFNPINLVAAPTPQRGVMEPEDEIPPDSGEDEGQPVGETPNGASSPGDRGANEGGGNVEVGNERRMASSGALEETDNAAFNDPFATIASAAADIDPEDPVAVDAPQSTVGVTGATQQTEDVRDPFDPAYWQTIPQRPAQTLRPGRSDSADTPPPNAVIDATAPRPRGDDPDPEVAVGAPESVARSTADVTAALSEGTADVSRSVGPRSTLAEQILAEAGEATAPARANAPDAALTDAGAPADDGEDPFSVEARARAASQALEAALEGVAAEVSLTAGERAVLVSLTDENAFSMFPIGSSTPSSSAQRLFERVGGVLAGRDGAIVVRGHTDARPFRSGTSDNWMLSFARAHATKEALRTGGVAEQRFVRVEGLADREPAMREDPFADENRRIEILYQPAEVQQ